MRNHPQEHIVFARHRRAKKNVFLSRRASGSLRRSVCGARADNKHRLVQAAADA